MKRVFADTAFYLALINRRDQFHHSAIELNETLRAPMVTTALVMLEFANAMAEGPGWLQFARVINGLRSQPDVIFVEPEPGLFERGCQLYASRADKEWSLTDCISFCVMKEHSIEEALTPDHHFAQAGFRPLMRV